MAHVYKEAFIKMVSAVLLELPNINDKSQCPTVRKGR